MATAKELRVWAASIRRWARMIDDTRVAEHAASLAAELDNLAARKEVVDRQFVYYSCGVLIPRESRARLTMFRGDSGALRGKMVAQFVFSDLMEERGLYTTDESRIGMCRDPSPSGTLRAPPGQCLACPMPQVTHGRGHGRAS